MIIYLIWYIVILGIGMVYMPLSMMLFEGWNDRGWIFSKSLGILTGAFAMWVMNCLHVLRFRTMNCFIMLLLPAAAFAALFALHRKRHPQIVKEGLPWKRILAEEAAFFLLLALWTYIIGFKPEAYGTEKYMDYGFITSMMRSEYMPFADPWYAGETVNYYYGGQYISAYLIRLTQVRAGEGYNLMRALVAAMSFMLPFSLASQMMRDRLAGLRIRPNAAANAPLPDTDRNGKPERRRRIAETAAGITAGCAVAFCGNFHYVVYGIIVPLVLLVRGSEEPYRYWFPDSTRYIGYHPETDDKTIHEFPSYSTILGDLHAHYINILFVVLVTAVVYAWARRQFAENETLALREKLLAARTPANESARAGKKPRTAPENASAPDRALAVLGEILRPEILLIGFMTGLFRWTNFWDFPIYYVVCGSIIFFTNLRRHRAKPSRFWGIMLAQAAVMFLAGKIAALPFTATFDQISSEIGVTHSHSPLYQMLILWWLPVSVSVWFIACRIRERVLAVRESRAESPFAGVPVSGADGQAEKTAEEETVSASAAQRAGMAESPLPAPEEEPEAKAESNVLRALRAALREFLDFFENLTLPDMAAVLFAACAMGLVWLPEVIYVKDIYTSSHYRANTMFKLTYQAFILFGIVMGYVLIRAFALRRRDLAAEAAKAGRGGANDTLSVAVASRAAEDGGREAAEAGREAEDSGHGAEDSGRGAARPHRRTGLISVIAAALALCMLLLTGGYLIRGTSDWFGNIFRPSERISTDASVFISETFPNDFAAVSWLNTHVPGQPVILEANGDSYSDYGRVSVATGLPTVMGWYVHEWLWRNNTAAQNLRADDIKTIYTSQDEEMVRVLVDKYHIRYIYIGSLEREKFPDLNDALLQRLGEVAYSDGKTTYIMRVGG